MESSPGPELPDTFERLPACTPTKNIRSSPSQVHSKVAECYSFQVALIGETSHANRCQAISVLSRDTCSLFAPCLSHNMLCATCHAQHVMHNTSCSCKPSICGTCTYTPPDSVIINQVTVPVDLIVGLMGVQHLGFIGPHCTAANSVLLLVIAASNRHG